MKTWRLVGLVVAAATGLGGVAAPRASEACMRMKARKVKQVDRNLQAVRRAEKMLAAGNDKGAAKVAKRTFRKFHGASGEPGVGDALFNRAQRTIALATVRADGAMDLGREMRGKSEFDKLVNLAWATTVLEVQAAAEPDNLLLRTFYAEALAHQPSGDGQALDLLDAMARDDLMPTARGFALMASLQHRRGDPAGSELSLERCRELGAEDDVCTVA